MFLFLYFCFILDGQQTYIISDINNRNGHANKQADILTDRQVTIF